MDIVLRNDEVQELLRQDPKTKRDGGFQSLIVRLQRKVDTHTGKLTLDAADLEQIARYAFKYKNGGWQNRLLAIFSRTLGPQLDGAV